MAETSSGSSMPPTPGQVDGQAEQVGPAGQRRQRPGEGEREVELVGWLLVLGEEDDGVLEGEEDPGVDVEGEVQVERAAAALLGVQVDLPDLAQRVGLDEVPLVVDVESVVDGMVLQVGDVAGDVDGSHNSGSLMGVADAGRRAGRVRHPWTTFACSRCSTRPSRAVRGALDVLEDWGPSGGKPGQYRLDLAADGAALPRAARRRPGGALRGVGRDRRRPVGAAGRDRPGRRLDQRAPGRALLLDEHLRARRRRAPGRRRRQPGHRRRAMPPCAAAGRRRTGRPIAPSGCEELGRAIVGISGFPGQHPGWAQFRALGAASLECCAVAEGVLDAYLVVGRSTLYGWDYLAGSAHLPRGGSGRRRSARAGTWSCATPRAGGPSWRRRAQLAERLSEEEGL